MKTVLFQGDSITDAGRSREYDNDRGIGYPTLVSARLGMDFPNQYTYLNRGNSGDRIVDVYARIKKDILNLQPDYLSILVGVNDVWHEIDWQNGVSAEKFEKIYCMLIEEIYEDLPNIKILILEPFVLKGTATTEKWDTFNTEVKKRAAASKRVAEKFGLPFISLQDKFDAAVKLADESYWLIDGVHPTAFGHELIAREWVKTFKSI